MRLYAKQVITQIIDTQSARELTAGTIIYYLGHNSSAKRVKITEPPIIKNEKLKLPYEGGWLTDRDFATGLWAKEVR
jgi:hypothetical protein